MRVLKIKMFIYMALALSTLFYITTGIQYWISDYLQIVLEVPADEVFYFFSFTCLSAPFLGIVTGGICFASVGGYNSDKAFPLLIFVGTLAGASAIPAPFLHNKYAMYLLQWCLFYFGAFLLPTMTGIMLNSVDVQRRTTANSLATLSYNMFGYLPAPFIYGWISSQGNDIIAASRRAMACLMFASIATFILLLLGFREKLKLRQSDQPINSDEEVLAAEAEEHDHLVGDTGGNHYLRSVAKDGMDRSQIS